MSNPTFVRNPSPAQREQLRAQLVANLAEAYGAEVAVAQAEQLPHTNRDPELAAWLADELLAAQ